MKLRQLELSECWIGVKAKEHKLWKVFEWIEIRMWEFGFILSRDSERSWATIQGKRLLWWGRTIFNQPINKCIRDENFVKSCLKKLGHLEASHKLMIKISQFDRFFDLKQTYNYKIWSYHIILISLIIIYFRFTIKTQTINKNIAIHPNSLMTLRLNKKRVSIPVESP